VVLGDWLYAKSSILRFSSKSKRFKRAGPVYASALSLLLLFVLGGIALVLLSLLAPARPNVGALLRV
jgi:hypothetical protein